MNAYNELQILKDQLNKYINELNNYNESINTKKVIVKLKSILEAKNE